ncbi:unnamed protein product [Linum tenue]|uniref:Uncharacterized protein n=1 Tax=Linum tenue TaxID=586396 RepID=A0AAV0GVS5_9ROSI|nr:unnamed protein product [Linum tenue]
MGIRSVWLRAQRDIRRVDYAGVWKQTTNGYFIDANGLRRQPPLLQQGSGRAREHLQQVVQAECDRRFRFQEDQGLHQRRAQAGGSWPRRQISRIQMWSLCPKERFSSHEVLLERH